MKQASLTHRNETAEEQSTGAFEIPPGEKSAPQALMRVIEQASPSSEQIAPVAPVRGDSEAPSVMLERLDQQASFTHNDVAPPPPSSSSEAPQVGEVPPKPLRRKKSFKPKSMAPVPAPLEPLAATITVQPPVPRISRQAVDIVQWHEEGDPRRDDETTSFIKKLNELNSASQPVTRDTQSSHPQLGEYVERQKVEWEKVDSKWLAQVCSSRDVFFRWTLIAFLEAQKEPNADFRATKCQIEVIQHLQNFREIADLFALHPRTQKTDPKLQTIYKNRSYTQDFNRVTILRAKWDTDRLIPLPAVQSDSCRAYRTWKSKNFLSIHFGKQESPLPPRIQMEYPGLDSFGTWEFLFAKIESGKAFYIKCGKSRDAHSFREWLAPVSDNDSMKVAKYNARIALAFSASIPLSAVIEDAVIHPESQANTHVLVDDINHCPNKAGESVMTDGCGFISSAFAEQISFELGFKFWPRAFQGRFGGYKGVWVVAAEPLPNSAHIAHRPSQRKFEPNPEEDAHRLLEILSYSKAQSGNLNEGSIRFLLLLGLPPSVIHDLKAEEVECLHKRMFQPLPTLLRTVRRGSPTSSSRLFLRLAKAGFTYDQFMLRNYLANWYVAKSRSVKESRRIPVPESALLLMIPDHTGTLAPDEVSIQFSDPLFGGISRVVNKEVVVFRSPLQLISDVRKMKAVDCPELRYLKDCVVFSTQGTVSPGSLLSGGDYDGDKAWVIWDQRFSCIRTCEKPANPIKNTSAAYSHEDEAGSLVIGDLQEDDLAERLREYCSSQDAYKYLGMLSTKLSEYFTSFYEALGVETVPEEVTARMEKDPHIQLLGNLCAMAVDAPKAGMRVNGKKVEKLLRSIESSPKSPEASESIEALRQEALARFSEKEDGVDPDLCMPYRSHHMEDAKQLLYRMSELQKRSQELNISIQDQMVRQDEKEEDFEELDAETIEEDAPSADFVLKWKELKYKYILQRFPNVPERLQFASLCYQLHHNSPHHLHFELWELFLEEFCRLKANAASLRCDPASLGAVVAEEFHDIVYL